MKGKFDLQRKFEDKTIAQCFISEITLAELKYGVENSQNRQKNKIVLESFITGVQILPIFHSLDLYASEKVRLKRLGKPVDDFDLLIGVSAVAHGLVITIPDISSGSTALSSKIGLLSDDSLKI